ncbi:MAG: hypothetical protein A3I71_02900 [Omnitrophica WOR_2 bacterium RIFCSPLOWO2_02_FULL_63_16]|nr:MAG: hypothetical protein A2Z92_04345 [Omnitrophica WOR_2 bacterium GWA2_63_20]OGX36989.1 MAG: hypothetical protein A3B73_01645 [Omnitrophica WOR_2 bacterium RIFCSPHIGHO2_02_FULL_63_39]OGX46405.1 MAG: hypothetical protein A3I71_02900 [Omnitrophica WOR_2 bacterium RIFCSPLOWO2_02_FULL_63_16]OGX49843.1 MAG: hypothetical protein A3G88_01380 [Omnitrophica WOR_2 bacterium RIFCSPLOWO2_12_FULL_63_16]HAM40416.1 hypothetical protein [Candidatus Omnitrophota bacterium]
MWRWLTRQRRLQQRYHRTLAAAANGMTRIKELPRLCRLIVYIVNRAVGLTNSALFLHQPARGRYELVAVRYQHLMPTELILEEGHETVEMLKRQRGLVVGQSGWMAQWEWRVLVPSFSNERLLGFLALGAKRTGARYTPDDLELFSTLASQATLGIENAMFFEELKANEASLIQSEKLATLGHLASGLMHELKNPLTIISGEAQVYLERFKGKDPEVDALLASIIEEAHRASEMAHRVVRFAKPAPEGVPRQPVDLRALLEAALVLASYPVRASRVEPRLEVPSDLPAVEGHATQLQEVFLNLLLQASDALKDGGGAVEVSAGAVDGQVEIRVKHSGPAIAPRKLARLFEVDGGLRLFVSRRIIQAHGGTLKAASAVGEGTTFTVRLPARREPIQAARSAR